MLRADVRFDGAAPVDRGLAGPADLLGDGEVLVAGADRARVEGATDGVIDGSGAVDVGDAADVSVTGPAAAGECLPLDAVVSPTTVRTTSTGRA